MRQVVPFRAQTFLTILTSFYFYYAYTRKRKISGKVTVRKTGDNASHCYYDNKLNTKNHYYILQKAGISETKHLVLCQHNSQKANYRKYKIYGKSLRLSPSTSSVSLQLNSKVCTPVTIRNDINNKPTHQSTTPL